MASASWPETALEMDPVAEAHGHGDGAARSPNDGLAGASICFSAEVAERVYRLFQEPLLSDVTLVAREEVPPGSFVFKT